MTLTLDRNDATTGRDITTWALTESASPVQVTGRLVGPDTGPAVVVLGGISSGRQAALEDDSEGWWACQAGPGKAIDTEAVRVLSLDFIGDEIAPYPSTTDQACAILALADAAGLDTFAIVGASYGGMIALALAILAPERIETVLAISAAHRASAMAQAWRSIQRDTVELALRLGDGAAGLDLARRLAMTTYRTPEEIEDRFYDPDPHSRDAAGVARYLEARGQAYADAVTPERFLALSHSMDRHFIDPEEIACPVTCVAVAQDRLVPADQIADCARRTPRGRLVTLHSAFGHDAFLKEEAAIGAVIRDTLRR